MNKVKIITCVLFAIMLGSCSDFLELKHESNVGADDFNKNTDELFSSLMGCYNGMQGALYREWAVTELRSDNSRISVANTSSALTDEIRQLDISNIQSINELVDEYWIGNYHNISRCNVVLRDFAVVENLDLRDNYKAEALFIRAYHYFNLVRLYGGVSLVTEPITAAEGKDLERSHPDDIYAQIISDLKEIVDNDMLENVRPDAELGRVTMLAVKTLLAKVYMTYYEVGSAEYLLAKPLLEGVIAGVGSPQAAADLEPFADIFKIDNEMNKEIIFAVRYKSGNLGIGNRFGNEFAPSGSAAFVINGQGSSWNYPSTSIVNAFNAEAGDLRKEISLADSYQMAGGVWKDDHPCRYVKKYINPVTIAFDGEGDWPIIRVADVLLLYAELVNEIDGPTVEAVKYVDMIRDRAGLLPLATDKTSNRNSFRKALRNERRLELAFENHRWFDLLRWDIAVQQMTEHYGEEDVYLDPKWAEQSHAVPVINEWRTLLPIPLNVTNINPKMTQNFGY